VRNASPNKQKIMTPAGIKLEYVIKFSNDWKRA
jgi:hypothetical protein